MKSVRTALGIAMAIIAFGTIAETAVAGSSSVLVYSCGRGFSNLCQIQPSGHGQKLLTRDGSPANFTRRYDSPSLSRDGRTLAYLRGSQLYVVDRVTGRRRGPISRTASLARVSPDGSKVGDLELYPAPPPAIGSVLTACVFPNRGEGRRRCQGTTQSFGFSNHDHVLASVQYSPETGHFETGICIFYPVTRGCDRFLAVDFGHDLSDPALSPNGKLLAVTRSLPGHAQGGIALYNYATGRLIRQLTTGTTDSGPAWAPDGSRLAFVRGATSSSPRIYTVSVNGGASRFLVKGRAVSWGR